MAILEHIRSIIGGHWPDIILVVLLSRLLSNKYGQKLNDIPGPFLAGFTDLWRFVNVLIADSTKTHVELHRTLNSNLVRIGPRTISVADPSLIPLIYGVGSKFTKTAFYSIVELPFEGKFQPGLFEARDESYHASIRKPIAQAYSMSAMIDFEKAVDSTIALFMSRMGEFAASGECFDLGVWLHRYTFGVLGEIHWSKKLGFLESGTDVESIMAGIRVFLRYFESVGQIPWLDRLLTKNALFLSFGPKNPIVTFALNRMKERTTYKARGGETKRDFLDRCLEAQAKYPDVVTDRMIMMYTFDNLGTGSDTTGVALTAIFYYLLKSRDCMRKLVYEIDTADVGGQLGDIITWQDANNLPYLQACIKEAMRLHPSLGLLFERHVPKGGICMAGHFLPEGTIVGVNPWVSARSREVFGTDCDEFRPDRWLGVAAEQLAIMERANLNFGHGQRACLGRNISMLEIGKLVPQLLRQYKLSLARPNLEWKVRGGWMVWQDGVEVCISKREEDRLQ